MKNNQLRNRRVTLLMQACAFVIVIVAFSATATVGVLEKFSGTLA
jgi:hypothetical protein